MPERTYDPGQCTFTFAGIQLTGFAKGSFLTAERASPNWEKYVGVYGEGARCRKRDKSGMIKFKTMSTSPINDILSDIATTDEDTGEGQGVFGGVDGNGTTVLNASSAWITKWPSKEFADTISELEWELECIDLDLFLGGNS